MRKFLSVLLAAILVTGQGFAPAHMSGTQAKFCARRAAIVMVQREAADALGKSQVKFQVTECIWNPDGSCTVTGLAE